MAGYIRHRGKNSWQVTIDLGRDAQGRRRQAWRSVKGKRRDAEEVLVRMLRERDTGIDINPGQLTVASYLARWMRDYAAHSVAASTLERYEGIVEHHLIPALGNLKLRDLRPAHIQAAYSSFSRHDGRGSALSTKSIAHNHAVLREALAQAVRWQLLAYNPVDGVKPPRVSRPEMRVLSRGQSARFLEAAAQTPHYALFSLALATGARIGELLALRWQDVDLERGTMQVMRSARFFAGKGIVISAPKTHRSRRPIALSPETARVLADHRRRQLEHRLTVGPAYHDRDLVFAGSLGDSPYDSTIRRAFYAIVKAAGLHDLRIHDLRHTAATLMLQAGVNAKVVSERLGHSKVGFTLDTYSHVLPDMQREAAMVVDDILVGNWWAKTAPEGRFQ